MAALIEFRDVCARYPGQANNALTDISFVATPGTVTAIVYEDTVRRGGFLRRLLG